MTPAGKLKIGLLQDGVETDRYMVDLITWAGTQDDLEISHLIIHGAPDESRFQTFKRKLAQHKLATVSKALFRVILMVERTLLRFYYGGRYRDHSRQYRVDGLIPNTIRLTPTISKSGLVYRFSDEEIAKVRATGCDVLIRGGTGILRGEILEVCPFGVLSFHHGDNQVNRGGPAAFWESFLGWPATGFVIQRLTSELDGGKVLLRGRYATKWFFLLNQAALFSKSNVHFKDLLKRVARERALPRTEDPLPYSAQLYRSPSPLMCIRYAATIAGRALQKGLYSLFRLRYRWSVSFVFTGWRRAVLWRTKTIPTPAGHFLADPFLWRQNGKTFCLLEDYSYRKKIAGISVVELTRDGSTPLTPVLSEPYHLSFPYLFEYDGAIYLCPECSASGQIRLYRATRFPEQWQFVKAVMNDVSAADSMIFPRGDRWWMLTNLDRSGDGDFWSELYLFSAESPLSERWVAHPSNPLIIDPRGGRNAGLLRDGDRLFRAAQTHGFDQYGAGILLYEIVSITPDKYEERLVGDIKPEWKSSLLGTHHISSVEGVTVVDYARREFVP
jgi:hypothetical protein